MLPQATWAIVFAALGAVMCWMIIGGTTLDPERSQEPETDANTPRYTTPRRGTTAPECPDEEPYDEAMRILAQARGKLSASVRGRVVLRDGAESSGVPAAITLRSDASIGEPREYRVTCDSDGRFAIDDVRYPMDYRLCAEAPEHGVLHEEPVVVLRRETTFSITVKRVACVTGRIRVSGQPTGGLSVVLACYRRGKFGPARDEERCVTAPDGTFRMTVEPFIEIPRPRLFAGGLGIDPGELELRASSPWSFIADGDLVAGHTMRGDVAAEYLTQDGGAYIRVVVVRSARQVEVANVDPEVLQAMGSSSIAVPRSDGVVEYYSSSRSRVRPDGSFVVNVRTPLERAYVVLEGQGFPSDVRALDGRDFESNSTRLDTFLPRAAMEEIGVTVQYENGETAEDVRVIFQRADFPKWLQVNSPWEAVGKDGVLRTRHLVRGAPYNVGVRGPGITADLECQVPQAGELVLTLERPIRSIK